PEVSAASRRPIRAQGADRGHRHLQQSRPHFMGESGGVWIAIMIVANRIETRAVAVSGFGDTIVGRLVRRANRKAGCAVSSYRPAGNILQHGLRPANVGEELSVSLLVGPG